MAIIKMNITCPHCGEQHEYEYEKVRKAPANDGIALEDMTLEQLRREVINAKSVLTKAIQRGADQSKIDAATERVNKASFLRDELTAKEKFERAEAKKAEKAAAKEAKKAEKAAAKEIEVETAIETDTEVAETPVIETL